ncbi:MAG TPA: protein kinase [Planctomycetaceae bacterium]|nr:protein kinase [Planctomycetaceae bacterium]
MITPAEFQENLAASGLFNTEEVQAILEPLQSRHVLDAAELAHELVRQGILTRYQAAAIYQGKLRGLILGDYVILEKLGAGGMGLVFKAQHRRMKRLVALKLLAPSITQSRRAVERFQREVEAAAKLVHSNIVTAYDAGEHNQVHYLVMEFVDGRNLEEIVKTRGPLSVRRAMNYTLQAARGLLHAHQQGVVHRDIKPANLLLDQKDAIKVLDMGLARIRDAQEYLDEIEGESTSDSSSELTQAGAVFGTLDFMAPEQADSTRDADHRADIYSLGCTLYYVLTGRAVYRVSKDADSLAKIAAHREAPVPSLRTTRGDVPAELDRIFQKMLAKDIENRFQSMEAVVSALERCTLEGMQPRAASDPFLPAMVCDDSELLRFLQAKENLSTEGASGREATVNVFPEMPPSLPPLSQPPPPAVARERDHRHRVRIWTMAVTAMLLIVAPAASWLLPSAWMPAAPPPPPGLLRLEIIPSASTLLIDGERPHGDMGSTESLRIVSVAPGQHAISVRRPGFKTLEQQIAVAAGQELTLTIRLKPEPRPIASTGVVGGVSVTDVPAAPQELNVWPGTYAGLQFVWENSREPNELVDPETEERIKFWVEPHGLAKYSHYDQMDLDRGWYEADASVDRGLAERLRLASQQSNQFALELCLTSERLGDSTPHRIVAVASDPYTYNFVLEQQDDRLLFRLRTTKGAQDRAVELCRIRAGRPQHLLVTYFQGVLVCYLDGEPVLASLAIQGDFANWGAHPLSFGSGDNAGWAGQLEGVALHSRFIGAEEARQRATLYRERIRDRKPVARFLVEAKLLRTTPVPTTGDAPQRALVVCEYEVAESFRGNDIPAEIRVAHWAVLGGRIVDKRREIGRTYRLQLERFDDNPQLADETLLDADSEAGAPQFYALGAD